MYGDTRANAKTQIMPITFFASRVCSCGRSGYTTAMNLLVKVRVRDNWNDFNKEMICSVVFAAIYALKHFVRVRGIHVTANQEVPPWLSAIREVTTALFRLLLVARNISISWWFCMQIRRKHFLSSVFVLQYFRLNIISLNIYSFWNQSIPSTGVQKQQNSLQLFG